MVTYSEVTVEADAIPPWGRCHRRRGNNVILKDSTGAEDCMRCFHLSMKTPNVIQLHSEGIERCYTNEEAARATCPLDKDVHDRKNDKKFKEIILYRKWAHLTHILTHHIASSLTLATSGRASIRKMCASVLPDGIR